MKRKLLFLAVLFITNFGFSQTGIQSTDTPPTVAQGQTFSVSFNYIAPVAGTCQVQLFKTDTAGNIDYSMGTDLYFADAIPAATTSTPFSTSFTVPANFATSSSLPAGVVYKWFFKIAVSGTDYYTGNNLLVITAPLAVDNFNKENAIFVNSSSKSLNIDSTNNLSSNANVFDVSGKKVMSDLNLKQKSFFDLSSLISGVYILVTDDNKKIKFVL